MPVSLRTHTDIARALKLLEVSLEDVHRLEPARAKDPSLAKALVAACKDVDGRELKRLRAAIGALAPDVSLSPTPAPSAHPQLVARLPVAKNGEEPRVQANVPAVAVLLQRYGVQGRALKESDGVAPRPLERVLVHAAKVHELLASETDPDKLLDKVMATDLRRHVFLLEGIGKIYQRRYDQAANAGASAKRLEDALGGLSATRTNLAYAQQVKAPPPVLAVLVKAEKDAKRELKGLLIEQWMPNKHGRIPALADMLEQLADTKWQGYAEDKKYLRGELVRRLAKVADTDFDMGQLETGIHELRRQLRWFPIYAEASNGLIQLDEQKNPVAAYQPLLKLKLATSKYVDLPDDAREVDAIRISKSLYTAVIQLTLDLGGIKDAGEPVEALFAAYLDSKQASNHADARAQVFKLIGSDRIDHDVHDGARKLYAEMKDNKLVEKLAEQVKKG